MYNAPKYLSKLAVIVANVLPIWLAFIGKLTFFDVLYLYWFESLLLIVFRCVKIGFARGQVTYSLWVAETVNKGYGMNKTNYALQPLSTDLKEEDGTPYRLTKVFSTWEKTKMIIKIALARVGVLLFYLIFMLVFLLLMVNNTDQKMNSLTAIVFRDSYFNTAIIFFIFSMITQLLQGFFANGAYKKMSPKYYATVFDSRTILLHVTIIGSVFLHQFLFKGKSYEFYGQMVYVAIFIALKMVAEYAQVDSNKEGLHSAEATYI